MQKKRPPTSQIAREGVNKFEGLVLKLGHIWREQPIEDVGVDGIIELCLDNFPTGKLIGVQVKSGLSYFQHTNHEQFTYYPDKADIDYWSKLTLPLVMVFFHPENFLCFWKDVSNEIEYKSGDLHASRKLDIPYKNIVDESFNLYLKKLFDLEIPSDTEFQEITDQLQLIKWENPESGLNVTGLDIFIGGLWGLCTKLQFHLSIITDTLKHKMIKNNMPAMLRMQLDRHSLQPLIVNYLRLLKEKRLADFDTNDVNHTLYVKWEWPTFIATLTPAGRKYIDFLRSKFSSSIEICDKQYFNLLYLPHVFIEVFDNYFPDQQQLGNPLRSLIIKFNRFIDDYIIQDILWQPEKFVTKNFQHISFEELRYYINTELKDVPKNNILLRHQDEIVSPLCCWLEEFIDNSNPVNLEELSNDPPSNDRHLAYELFNTFSVGADSVTVSVPEIIDVGELWIKYHIFKAYLEAQNKK